MANSNPRKWTPEQAREFALKGVAARQRRAAARKAMMGSTKRPKPKSALRQALIEAGYEHLAKYGLDTIASERVLRNLRTLHEIERILGKQGKGSVSPPPVSLSSSMSASPVPQAEVSNPAPEPEPDPNLPEFAPPD